MLYTVKKEESVNIELHNTKLFLWPISHLAKTLFVLNI